ncbi:MAG: tRNA epoxyqueuosine(34) reductase QueG [Bacteroidales bacterium]|nr:tRNA epoxyqueuosine(34) reductase QueG [Bacteroidales bacterium]
MSAYSKKDITKLIKEKALELRFDDCGISKAEFLPEHEKPLKEWIIKNQGYHPYLEKNTELRLDASKLFKNAKSVISLIKNYYPESKQKGKYLIAKYAYGQDYHNVIKSKLFQLIDYISSLKSDFTFKAFVDSSPFLEKAMAVKSGLGQIGKNNLLITNSSGSFFFLSEIIIDFELEYDESSQKDVCGNCSLCIDACPTNALYAPYHLDVSKCISALTIEIKDPIPEEFKGKLNGWIYGCDICQDVCPHNNNSIPHNEPLFYSENDLLEMSDDDWENLTEETFKSLFKQSAIKRTKYNKFYSNILFNK